MGPGGAPGGVKHFRAWGVLLLAVLVGSGCAAGSGGDELPAEAARGIEVRRVGDAVAAPELTGEPGVRAVIHFWGGDSLRADRIARSLSLRPDLPALPPGVPHGAHIVLAPDPARFDSLTGGLAPEWGAGVAVPSLGRIVLPVYADSRTRGWDEPRVLHHEWAHLGLHQSLPGLRIPRWFDEGFAEWASGSWTAEEGWRLRVAMALGRLPPLDSLSLTWPRERASADLSYLLSASAIDFLVDRSGERGLALLIQRWGEGGDFEAAFRRTYGLTGSQMEEAWRKHLRRRYGWLTVLSQATVVWAVGALLLVALVAVRRRRDGVRLARLREEEPPDAPAFWLDEPLPPPLGSEESDDGARVDPRPPEG